MIGALRTVQVGSVEVLGQRLDGAGRRQRQQLRRRIGMIFQGHNLLRCLTAEQNVQMGSDLLPNLSYRARRDQAREWLRSVGLADHLGSLPHDLSGGQKQRVAIEKPWRQSPICFWRMSQPQLSTASQDGKWLSYSDVWPVNNPVPC